MEKLLRGDALLLMKEFEPFDVLLTDPPYCSGGSQPARRFAKTSSKYSGKAPTMSRPDFAGEKKDQFAYFAWMTLWLAAAFDLAKPEAYAFVFTDCRQVDVTKNALQAANWAYRGLIPWHKTKSGTRPPGKGNFWNECEYIVWGRKGEARADIGMPDGLYVHPRKGKEDRQYHQTQKPVALLEKILAPFGAGSVVLDPFAGSGSTLMACRNLGMKFQGCELSDEVFEVAEGRIRTN